MDGGYEAERLEEADREHNLERRLSPRQEAAIRVMAAPLGELPDLGTRGPEGWIGCLLLVAMPGLSLLAGGLLSTGSHGEKVATALVAAVAALALAAVILAVASKRRRDRAAQEAERYRDLVALDVERREIVSENGEIVWEGDRYVCRAAGRVLIVPPPSAWPVPVWPGRHRFFWLAESGLLLTVAAPRDPGAEHGRAYTVSPPTRPARIDYGALADALAQANGFEKTWLADLRRGVVPRGAVMREARQAVGAGAVFSGVIMSILALAVFTRGGSDDVLRPLLFMALLGLVTTLPFIIHLVMFLRAVRAGRMNVFEGAVGLVDMTPPDHPRRTGYAVCADHIPVSEAAARALVEGLTYRVCYVAEPMTLLGIEPIDAIASGEAARP